MKVLIALVLFVAVINCGLVSWKGIRKIPNHWVEANVKPDSSMLLPLRFAVKPSASHEKLHDKLMSVSDPRSPQYGEHLCLEGLRDFLDIKPETISELQNFLKEFGVYESEVTLARDWISFKATVKQIETMFNTELSVFVNTITQEKIVRSAFEYSLPEEIGQNIEFVAGLVGFPFKQLTLQSSRTPMIGGSVTPEVIYNMYGVAKPTSSTPVPGNSQAIVEFGLNWYSESDLQDFYEKYAPQLQGQKPNQVYGENKDIFTSIEANLDIQYESALGPFTNTSVYTVALGTDTVDAFLDYTYVVGNETQPPLVHSISFGEYGGKYDNSTVQRLAQEFQKMGIRGISVMLASGDNGVGCNIRCTSEEFDFPSNPYITMVGATRLAVNSNEEVGATFSSGGFSRDFWQPSWQSDAVEGYLNSNVSLPPASMYDQNGRAYPDISAVGQDIAIIVRGKESPVAGTSCSAPITAGIIADLNAYRLSNGKQPLGFLNPLLYQNPQMFNDITSGDNSYKCCQGFEASEGWDPVTGLGTPNYPEMLKVVQSLS